jgi:hypothetical protein
MGSNPKRSQPPTYATAPIFGLGLFALTNSLVSYANRHEPNPVPHAKPAHINPAHVDEEPATTLRCERLGHFREPSRLPSTGRANDSPATHHNSNTQCCSLWWVAHLLTGGFMLRADRRPTTADNAAQVQFQHIGNCTYQVLGVPRCAICGRWKTTRHSSHE